MAETSVAETSVAETSVAETSQSTPRKRKSESYGDINRARYEVILSKLSPEERVMHEIPTEDEEGFFENPEAYIRRNVRCRQLNGTTTQRDYGDILDMEDDEADKVNSIIQEEVAVNKKLAEKMMIAQEEEEADVNMADAIEKAYIQKQLTQGVAEVVVKEEPKVKEEEPKVKEEEPKVKEEEPQVVEEEPQVVDAAPSYIN